ncbi:MAG: C39 family peptidase [Bryobacteraceae bacterium]
MFFRKLPATAVVVALTFFSSSLIAQEHIVSPTDLHNDLIPTARADEKTIQAALYSPEAKGVYGSDMERYLHQAGFSTFRFAGDWSDLRQHLSKGRPLIVCLQPKSPHDPLHYVVVTGLGKNQDSVLLNDPARGKLIRENGGRFEKEWKATGHWTLLVLPQHGP